MSSGTKSKSKVKKKRTLSTVCPNCSTDVMHWVHFAAAGEVPDLPPKLGETPADFDVNRKIFVQDGSITDLECDAIVVPVLKTMLPFGLNLVQKQAGEELVKAARKLAPQQISSVVETDSFKLPCRSVFHTVIPPQMESAKSHTALELCYTNALDLLVERGYQSMAFPSCLGSRKNSQGAVKLSCIEIGLKAVRQWMDTEVDGIPNHKRVDSVIFCIFDDRDTSLYEKYLHTWFPTHPSHLTMS